MMSKRTRDGSSYERLKSRVQEMKDREHKTTGPSDKDRADWAYGNTKMENSSVTRKMAREAVEKRKSR